MDSKALIELRGRHRELLEGAKDLQKKADGENRQMTKEEQTQFDALMREHDELGADIERRERLDAADKKADASERKSRPQTPDGQERRDISIEFPKSRIAALKAFKGPDAEERAYRTGMFLAAHVYKLPKAQEWCREHGIALRTMQEKDNTAGGVLVPDEFSRAVIDLRELYGVIRQNAQVVPMASDHIAIPRRTGSTTIYAVGESDSITASDMATDNVTLTAKKFAALTKISSELSSDAIINVADMIANDVGKGFAQREDECGIDGTGAQATYHGIVGIRTKMIDGSHAYSYVTAPGGAGTCDTWDEVGNDDLMSVLSAAPSYVFANEPKWYCPSAAVWPIFGRLLMAQGGATAAELAGTSVIRYAGYPVIGCPSWTDTAATDNSSKIIVFFGAMQLAVSLGNRAGFSLLVDNSRYMEYDQIAIRAITRLDINVHDIGDASARGALVGLYGN